ncbi:MAG: UxaA family hydrolase [Waltera sp.]
MESEKYSWQGYLRQDGRCGIRNHILVIYTVKCSEFVARKIVENSDDPDVELIGFDGCTDNQYAVNLLISMIRHPNVGAVLAVGLGCEYIQPEWLADIARKEGKPSEWLFIQNEGGTLNAVKKGLDWVGKAKKCCCRYHVSLWEYRDLVIGAECGGSDYTSGLAGNVVVGRLYDRLVDPGRNRYF